MGGNELSGCATRRWTDPCLDLGGSRQGCIANRIELAGGEYNVGRTVGRAVYPLHLSASGFLGQIQETRNCHGYDNSEDHENNDQLDKRKACRTNPVAR